MIFPSAFCQCVLYCKSDKQNILFFKHTSDTLFIELDFDDSVYNGSTFYCDYVEAVDGGFPFLVFYDVKTFCGIDASTIYAERLDILKVLIQNTDQRGHEYRLTTPTFFDNTEILYVYENVIPNLYCKTLGVQYTEDLIIKDHVDKVSKKQHFIARKTKYPEIYELYNCDGINKVNGNNLLYIQTLEMSRELSKLFSSRNSIKLSCEYHPEREKWVPLLTKDDVVV